MGRTGKLESSTVSVLDIEYYSSSRLRIPCIALLMIQTDREDRTKTVAITAAMPKASIPSCCRAAVPPPDSSPLGIGEFPCATGFPEATAKVLWEKKAIIRTPNSPPSRCPGNKPTGSENHLNLENHFSPARKRGPPISPRITALAGL